MNRLTKFFFYLNTKTMSLKELCGENVEKWEMKKNNGTHVAVIKVAWFSDLHHTIDADANDKYIVFIFFFFSVFFLIHTFDYIIISYVYTVQVHLLYRSFDFAFTFFE